MKKTRIAVIYACMLPGITVVSLGAAQKFTCTQVIGYSQVGQKNGGWYTTGGAFERVVGSDTWQLLWAGGAGVDRWQKTTFSGWSKSIISPCKQNSRSPDRVLLSVSAGYGSDENAWEKAIDASVKMIRRKIPSAKQIILQAVVGGPDHKGCPTGGGEVRASWQHKHIDNAIKRVAAKHADVVEGFSPEVRSCADYSDGKGHLKGSAASAIGTTIGKYYASNSSPAPDPDSTLDPDPTTDEKIDFTKSVKLSFGGATGEWEDGDQFTTDGAAFTFAGEVSTEGATDPAPAEVYKSVRHRGTSTEDLTFTFADVPNGTYTLRFHVADAFGGRAIDILAEDAKVVEDLDPVTEAGTEMKAVVKDAVVTVSDGNGLQITLTDDRPEPKDVFLGGLEIIRASGTVAVVNSTPVRISGRIHRGRSRFLISGRASNLPAGTVSRGVDIVPLQGRVRFGRRLR